MESDHIREEHVRQAFAQLRKEGVPRRAASTKYSVIDPESGLSFPPKLVLSLAAEIATGTPLPRKNFSGGAPTNRPLQALGFEIISKPTPATPYTIERLRPGDVLSASDLSAVFKVGNAGGMRWSSTNRCLVLITDHNANLYDDRWVEDVLHYTGEGTEGNQQLVRQNARLARQRKTNEEVHYFEVFEAGRYTYGGRMELAADPYQEFQPDRTGSNRLVYVFPLKRVAGQPSFIPTREELDQVAAKRRRALRRKSIEELRAKAEAGGQMAPGRRMFRSPRYIRCEAIVELTCRLAEGHCDLCGQKAPFNTESGPFLECHHVVPLANGGPDILSNTVALCPNCHRRMHVLKRPGDIAKLRKRIEKRDGEKAWRHEL